MKACPSLTSRLLKKRYRWVTRLLLIVMVAQWSVVTPAFASSGNDANSRTTLVVPTPELFATQISALRRAEQKANSAMLAEQPCDAFYNHFIDLITQLYAKKIIPSQSTFNASNLTTIDAPKPSGLFKQPLQVVEKTTASPQQFGPVKAFGGPQPKAANTKAKDLGFPSPIAEAIDKDDELSALFLKTLADVNACHPLQAAMDVADSQLSDAQNALFVTAKGLDPAGTNGYLRAAYGQWIASWVRRMVGQSLHTTIYALSTEPECQGDLTGDLVLHDYMQASAMGNTPVMEASRLKLLQQLACLDVTQTLALDSGLALGGDAIDTVVNPIANDTLKRQLKADLMLWMFPVVDVNKVFGPTMSSLFIHENAASLVQKTSPVIQYGLTLYDRKTGKTMNYNICPQEPPPPPTIPVPNQVPLQTNVKELTKTVDAGSQGSAKDITKGFVKAPPEHKSNPQPYPLDPTPPLTEEAKLWNDYPTPYGWTVGELKPKICPMKPAPVITQPVFTVGAIPGVDAKITKNGAIEQTNGVDGSNCIKIGDFTDSLRGDHLGFGVSGLVQIVADAHVDKAILCDDIFASSDVEMPGDASSSDDFSMPTIAADCATQVIQKFSKCNNAFLFAHDAGPDNCTNPVAGNFAADGMEDGVRVLDDWEDEVVDLPRPTQPSNGGGGVNPDTIDPPPGSKTPDAPDAPDAPDQGGDSAAPATGKPKGPPCGPQSLLDHVNNWVGQIASAVDEFWMPTAHAGDGKTISSEEELISAIEAAVYSAFEAASKAITDRLKLGDYNYYSYYNNESSDQYFDTLNASPYYQQYSKRVDDTVKEIVKNPKFQSEVKDMFITYMGWANPEFKQDAKFDKVFDKAWKMMLTKWDKSVFHVLKDTGYKGAADENGKKDPPSITISWGHISKTKPSRAKFFDVVVQTTLHEVLHGWSFWMKRLGGYDINAKYTDPNKGNRHSQKDLPEHKALNFLQKYTGVWIINDPPYDDVEDRFGKWRDYGKHGFGKGYMDFLSKGFLKKNKEFLNAKPPASDCNPVTVSNENPRKMPSPDGGGSIGKCQPLSLQAMAAKGCAQSALTGPLGPKPIGPGPISLTTSETGAVGGLSPMMKAYFSCIGADGDKNGAGCPAKNCPNTLVGMGSGGQCACGQNSNLPPELGLGGRPVLSTEKCAAGYWLDGCGKVESTQGLSYSQPVQSGALVTHQSTSWFNMLRQASINMSRGVH